MQEPLACTSDLRELGAFTKFLLFRIFLVRTKSASGPDLWYESCKHCIHSFSIERLAVHDGRSPASAVVRSMVLFLHRLQANEVCLLQLTWHTKRFFFKLCVADEIWFSNYSGSNTYLIPCRFCRFAHLERMELCFFLPFQCFVDGVWMLLLTNCTNQ